MEKFNNKYLWCSIDLLESPMTDKNVLTLNQKGVDYKAHIYILFETKTKIGDWILKFDNKDGKFHPFKILDTIDLYKYPEWDIIVSTSNPKLIADGVNETKKHFIREYERRYNIENIPPASVHFYPSTGEIFVEDTQNSFSSKQVIDFLFIAFEEFRTGRFKNFEECKTKVLEKFNLNEF